MTSPDDVSRIVTASREIAASADRIFALIADPMEQPRWDGNDNLKAAAPGQRVRAVGDVFTMRLSLGSIRENHVVEFVEGRCIAWRPAEPGQSPPGLETRTDRSLAHAGDPHLRLDRADRRGALSPCEGDYSRAAAGLARPARRLGRSALNRWP